MNDAGPERRAEPPPRFTARLVDVGRGARAAWAPTRIFPLTVVLLASWLAAPWLVARDTRGGQVLAVVLVVALAALLVLALAMVAGAAGWEYGRNCRWGVRESLKLALERAANLLASVLAVPLAVALLVLITVSGAMALAMLWEWLAFAWLLVIGLPLGVAAAFLAFLGVPALALMVPAATLDCREAFDTVSRSISYVRGRTGSFLAGTVTALVAAAISASAFALFVALVRAFLLATWAIATGGELTLATAVPFALVGGSELRPTADLPIVGSLLVASFLAAFVSGMARVYLLLRWAIDREPPSALLHARERAEWTQG